MTRSNLERTETTRAALTDAARALFITKGYAATSTPDICAAAGTTRGALYHHFADKRDLFRHVVRCEHEAVAAGIRAAAPATLAPRKALVAGTEAYLRAMTAAGRTRLLLIEGPAVLGLVELAAMDESNAAATLREGLALAQVGRGDTVSLDVLVGLLSAAFDRAALAIDAGADAGAVRRTVVWLLLKTLR